jgi:hypothetical protein
MAQTTEQRRNNLINSKKWTKEEEDRLVSIFRSNGWTNSNEVPYNLLEEKFPGRTQRALRSKLTRLIPSQKLTYSWDKDEVKEAFSLHLNGEPLKTIQSKLHEQGSTCSLEELEAELGRQRARAEQVIRAYAEERGLAVSKYLSLDTLNFFRNNYNTSSDFIRKALHSRITNG